MAYNYFPQTYQTPAYYPSQSNAYPTQMNVGPAQSNAQPSLIWVQGEAGAKSYMVAPNQTVVLWDSEAEVIYLKSADASGMPSIKILDYTIRDNGPKTAEIPAVNGFATKDEVFALQKEVNALKAKLKPTERKERKDG